MSLGTSILHRKAATRFELRFLPKISFSTSSTFRMRICNKISLNSSNTIKTTQLKLNVTLIMKHKVTQLKAIRFSLEVTILFLLCLFLSSIIVIFSFTLGERVKLKSVALFTHFTSDELIEVRLTLWKKDTKLVDSDHF
jgi:hypothetical protein